MRRYPSIPHLDDAPEILDAGHLWMQELVDGSLLRFSVGEDGTLAFGDSQRVFDGDPPLSLRPAIRHVRESLDWETLYDGGTDATAVTFFGVAPRSQGIDYDWDRIPPFLGTDVWHDEQDAFLPPDVVERVYDRVGLDPVTVLQKEVPTRDFDPDSYEIPQSAWADQRATGVVIRTKQGGRAKLLAEGQDETIRHSDDDGEKLPTAPDEIVAHYLTDDLLARVEERLLEAETDASPDDLHERALETVAREHYGELDRAGVDLDTRAVRQAARERVRSWRG
jgi:hypothetical protein